MYKAQRMTRKPFNKWFFPPCINQIIKIKSEGYRFLMRTITKKTLVRSMIRNPWKRINKKCIFQCNIIMTKFKKSKMTFGYYLGIKYVIVSSNVKIKIDDIIFRYDYHVAQRKINFQYIINKLCIPFNITDWIIIFTD